MINIKLPRDEFVDGELDIHYESIFTLEKELKNHPKIENKYNRWYAQANKELGLANLELEICIAELTDEICIKENIATYNRSEVRKSKIASNPKYIEAVKKVIDAQEKVDVLKGAISSMASKGWRLKELTYLANRLLWDEPNSSFTKKDYKDMDMSDHLNIER